MEPRICAYTKNSLALRLTVWFLVLSTLPLAIVAFSVLNDVADSFDDLAGDYQQNEARLMASVLENHLPIRNVQSLQKYFTEQHGQFYVVDTRGRFLMHPDTLRVGQSIKDSFSKNIVRSVLADGKMAGAIIEEHSGRAIGFAPIGQFRNSIVITVSDKKTARVLLQNITRSSQVQIIAGLIFVSIAGGATIWFLVGLPVRRLTLAAKEFGEDNLEVEVKPEKFVDELKILATNFNAMTFRIRELVKGFEQKIMQLEDAHTTIKENEDWLHAIIMNAQATISVVRADGTTSYESPSIEYILGYKPEERIGRSVFDQVHPDDHETVFNVFQEGLLKPGAKRTVELRFRHKNGTYRWLETNGHNLLHHPVVNGVVLNAHDITDRKTKEIELSKAHQEIRESEEWLRALITNAQGTISVFNAEGVAIYEGPSITNVLGYEPEELVEKNGFDKIHPDDVDSVGNVFKRCIENPGQSFGAEFRFRHKDGSWRWLDSQGVSQIDNPVISGIVVNSRDITDRKANEMELGKANRMMRESEEKHRTAMAASPDPIVMYDMDGKTVYINPAFTSVFGWTLDELQGNKIDYVPEDEWPETRRMLDRLVEGKGGRNFETRRYNKKGNILNIKMSFDVWRNTDVDPVGSIVILRDITEQKALEEKLFQSQKLEAVGTLAGGLAHDFNNLLMTIQGNISMLELKLPQDSPFLKHTNAVTDQVESATHLTMQLLGVARGGKYEVKPLDINQLVEKTSLMFGRTKKDVVIKRRTNTFQIVVEADMKQIEQVLLNLYVNASHAMPDSGSLFLSTTTVELDASFCRPFNVNAGSYAKISVRDTGVGMDKATMDKIFDPFFTTKELGRGTGLGLSSAFGIIQKHKGFITVDSTLGEGTTFSVYLPLAEGDPVQELIKHEDVYTGTETILLVDDEDATRDVCRQMLEMLEYRVIPAKSGVEGIDVVTNWGREIDLVVLDMIMPGVSGNVVFNRIRKIQPEIPILIASGYTTKQQADKIMSADYDGYIQKPFSIKELSAKMRKMFEKSAVVCTQ